MGTGTCQHGRPWAVECTHCSAALAASRAAREADEARVAAASAVAETALAARAYREAEEAYWAGLRGESKTKESIRALWEMYLAARARLDTALANLKGDP
jgi:hypothetical protein